MADVALPAPWVDLHTSRATRQQIQLKVEGIRDACQLQHQSENGPPCPSCRPQIVDYIKSLSSLPESAVYAPTRVERAAAESLVANGEKTEDGAEVTKAVLEVKSQWYRSTLASMLDLVVVDKHFNTEATLGALQKDPENLERIMQSMWHMLGQPADWPEKTEELIENVAAKGGEEPLRELCPIRSFRDEQAKNGSEAEDMRKRALQRSKAIKSQRAALQERLGELSRAKTAFEQTKVAQAKSRATSGAHPVAGPGLENLPVCEACGKALDGKDVISCAVCQVALQMSLSAGKDASLTVYCSEECYHGGQPNHIDKEHACAAGEDCTSMTSTEGDAMMNNGDGSGPVVFKDDLQNQVLTLFCSRSCGNGSLSRHRQGADNAARSEAEADELLLPLEEVVMQKLEEANSHMQFDWLSTP